MAKPPDDPSLIFPRSTLKRALERAGLDINTMGPEDLERALPSIRKALETFIPIDEANRRLDALKKLIQDRGGSG